jgi:hypothetical protein
MRQARASTRKSTAGRRKVPAQTFIFQSRQDKYDLRRELHPKAIERWSASRYRTAMRPGDIVYFWLAGPEDIRGIYGWGTIRKFPYHARGEGAYDVDVFVESVFTKPVLASDLRRAPELSDLLILRAPQATNFLLSRDEARRLAIEISKAGEPAPETPAPGRNDASSSALIQAQRRTNVFISYSHADLEWLRRLQVHLVPLERDRGFQFWDDSRIRPGEEWRRQIREAMSATKIAVLLISADFLASPFIMGNELPALLTAASDEGAIVLAVIVSPCRYVETEAISRFQAVNPPSRPLTLMTTHEREEVFYHVSIAIEAAMSRVHKAHD